MKYLFELVLSIIIIFFVWNILKRMFFNTFYKFPRNNPPSDKTQATKKSTRKNISNVDWDAETIEFEEVKEDTTHDKK